MITNGAISYMVELYNCNSTVFTLMLEDLQNQSKSKSKSSGFATNVVGDTVRIGYFSGNLIYLCSECGSTDKPTLLCSQCKPFWYCSKECQRIAWKRIHKIEHSDPKGDTAVQLHTFSATRTPVSMHCTISDKSLLFHLSIVVRSCMYHGYTIAHFHQLATKLLV